MMSSRQAPLLFLHLSLALLSRTGCAENAAAGEYVIGVGSYDVTGPAADLNMMG
jgi:hypothetical protein